MLISLQNTAKFHVISPRNVCPHEAATTILVKIFWNFNILVQVRFTTSKTKLYIYYSKLGRRAASRVASHLRKSRNIRKISNLAGDKGQPTLKKFDVGSSSQKSRKNGYETLVSLSSITEFLHFVPNILIA